METSGSADGIGGAPVAAAPSSPAAPRRRRLTLTDGIILTAAAVLLGYAAWRVNQVLVYHWDWGRVFRFVAHVDAASGRWQPSLLLSGLATTARLALWSALLAALIGGLAGYWRTTDNLTLRLISRGYVELVRNMPPLVFLFIFYFFLSGPLFAAIPSSLAMGADHPLAAAVLGWLFGDPALLGNFLTGVICLALFEGAYITEIVRAGIQAVPPGQWAAARAVGLSRPQGLRHVILPQAVGKMLPPLAGQFITLIKDSAIISLISIQELTFAATEVAATTTRVFETWIIVGAMYFALCYGLSHLFARWERRAAQRRR